MLKILKNFANGAIMGISEIIPGVSGGTIALILGFYYDLMESINHFFKNAKKNTAFLLPILLGMVTGIIVFASIIDYLLKEFSFPTILFFVGLIAGILPVVFRKAVKMPTQASQTKGSWVCLFAVAAIPAVFLIAMSYLPEQGLSRPLWSPDFGDMAFFLLGGILAAMALVLPGISGSFVLLIMGIYPIVTNSIASLKDWLGNMSNTELLLDIIKVLGPIGIGIIIGGLTMVRLMEKLLRDHSRTIYSIILGLLAGSVYALFNSPEPYNSGVTFPIICIGVIAFLAGGTISFTLGKKKL